MISILTLAACQTESNDVVTLNTGDLQRVEASTSDDPAPDEEAMMMAFTECLREQGVEALDPVVDADGNVVQPDYPEGTELDKETMGEAWEACEHHLEGFTAEKERVDMSEVVDQYVAFATCMRDKGYDIQDPTAETLDQWGSDWKTSINVKDPDALADYEECSGETLESGGEK
jgi:hypothetical protein